MDSTTALRKKAYAIYAFLEMSFQVIWYSLYMFVDPEYTQNKRLSRTHFLAFMYNARGSS